MTNVHASGLVIGDRGIMVTGPSGAGKSTLVLALLRHCAATATPGWLLGDDRLVLSAANGRLLARAPARIAGLAEIHGLGARPVAFEASAVIDLCVQLLPASEVPRLDPAEAAEFVGIAVPSLAVPQRVVAASLPAVMARIADSGASRGACVGVAG
ncbi:HPr kinase/phosphorylase [Nitratireductor mangrovi]|uniref:HPr kinase/phosphorylase n=1 Tax=Nitratireductor mangrovi TaxID=2599600 RepID=A0A5B8KVA8_9HYPH|nr:HPr kinase/phosphorylase [Nitratireductor mangrovi]QDY99501.1 HPr kinase/phosphorylase [Nitratireductor mangrovi]